MVLETGLCSLYISPTNEISLAEYMFLTFDSKYVHILATMIYAKWKDVFESSSTLRVIWLE